MPLADFLHHRATITQEAPNNTLPAQDPAGGADRSDAYWLTAASDVPCLVREKGATLNYDRNDQRANVITGTIYFLTDPVAGGLSSRHRVTVTRARDGVLVGVYAVQGVIDPNGMGDHFEVSVERIRTP